MDMKATNYLSKGCELCQQGKWLCIFLTYKCNANCHFCPAPSTIDRVQSAFGSKKEEILSYLLQNDFEGISFSGGDPFTVFDRLMEWQVYFKKNLPHYYYWVYTNGLDTDERKLEQLSVAGMDEIRFNIAATGYLSDQIWGQIKIAKKLFPYVSVEIPSIKQDFQLLEAALDKLDHLEVDYLNMHDYIISEPDANDSNEPSGTFVLNKINQLKYAYSSIANTQEIIKLASERRYNFHINHCSMQKKELQMTHRRLKMGKVFSDPEYDFVSIDGTILNTYYIPKDLYSDKLKNGRVDADFIKHLSSYRLKINQMNISKPSGFAKLVASYLPQMEIGQKKALINVMVF